VTHILLVDDHEVARRGIEGVLADALPGLRFGEAVATKLGLCSNVEIARYAMQHRLVD